MQRTRDLVAGVESVTLICVRWSSVFWDLYCAAPERRDTCEHSSEAKAFHDYVSTTLLSTSVSLHLIIIIIIIPGQCLWCCHHAVAALREFTLVHAMSAARRQVAADLWTKPIGLNHKPACRLPVNYTHHRHFIITQPES